MKWLFRAMTLLLCTLSPFAVSISQTRAARTELIMLTGLGTDTYYEIGRDLKQLLDEVAPTLAVDLAVVPTQGALQNAIEVFRHDQIQLGLTQMDLLAYLKIYGKESPDVQRILNGLQVVLPLGREEVHLLAKAPISSIGDLNGKRVAIGPSGSGTMVSALAVLYLAGIEPRELVNQETAASIAALRKGEIDAFFRVVGSPSEFLATNITANDQFALLTIDIKPKPADRSLALNYVAATIPANTYPWQDHAVETVSVQSLIVTSPSVPAGASQCEVIGKFARLILDNQEWLRLHGHPSWKNIDLNKAAILSSPRLSPCVAKQIGATD